MNFVPVMNNGLYLEGIYILRLVMEPPLGRDLYLLKIDSKDKDEPKEKAYYRGK